MPASDSTDISPTKQLPFVSHDGNRMIVELPTSSIVIEKSVPRTPIVAVGVFICTFVGLVFAIWPEAYRTVPRAALSDREPVFVFGS